MTGASLDDLIVAWALGVVGGDRLVCLTGLREGGPPWLMRYEARGGTGSAVVRVAGSGTAWTQESEVRAMRLARAGGVPTPGVIAARADDTAAVLLIEYVDGSSHQPAELNSARLAALGGIAARISMVDPGSAGLPTVRHPILCRSNTRLRGRSAQ